MARGWLLLALAVGLTSPAAPAGAQTCFGQAPTITGAGRIQGTPGSDVILGSDFANDVIDDGGGGQDLICSRGGDDRIKVRGTAFIDAGDGNDRIAVTNRGSSFGTDIDAGSGDDSIKFTTQGIGANEILGGPGRDVIKVRALTGQTTVDAGSDEDTIKFNASGGSNTVDGGNGIDTCKLKGPVNPLGCEEQ